MEDLRLNEDQEQEIFQLRRQASACFREKDFIGMQVPMIEAWQKLPDPKLNYGESFLIARMMCESAIGLKNSELAHEWLTTYKSADLNRIDSGEREFMEGRIAFMDNDFEKAKTSFSIADKKSDGRCWKGANVEEYFKFYKSK